MWLNVEFVVRPLNVIVHVMMLVLGSSFPVQVPEPLETTPAELPLGCTSFDGLRSAVYVIVFGDVDLLLPQATTNPRPSALASVNVCFCMGVSLVWMGN
jgi:hypothetical protein